MKTTRLLHSLENQLAELAARVAPMANHATLSPRFDRQLFRTAISRETATWSLRAWDSASPTLSRWQRRRIQHQEYERRLLAMRSDRQRQLAQATSLEEQQRLAKEVDAYAARLARCRDALEKIENRLARLTR